MQDKFAKDGEIFNAYQKIFKFHKTHAAASSDANWDRLAASLGDIAAGLESDLCLAAVNEIERSAVDDYTDCTTKIQIFPNGHIYVNDRQTGVLRLSSREEALKILEVLT